MERSALRPKQDHRGTEQPPPAVRYAKPGRSTARRLTFQRNAMKVYSVRFDGKVLNRRVWLYVIDIQSPMGRYLDVGRTGDSSSANAASPFARIGQHLDFRPTAKGNTLARN